MGPKIVNATLLYLFHYVETKLDGRPTLLLVDEAWLALSNPLFSDKLREWLKVLRKNNCAVVMATQSLSDVVSSPIRDAVFESCPTRLLLPNPEAQSAMMKKLYEEYLRLDDAEIALIASAEKKRHTYYASPKGTRLFELGLGPVSLSFLGASSKPELAAVRRLAAADARVVCSPSCSAAGSWCISVARLGPRPSMQPARISASSVRRFIFDRSTRWHRSARSRYGPFCSRSAISASTAPCPTPLTAPSP